MFDTVSESNENGLVTESGWPNALVIKSLRSAFASEHAVADRERIIRREADRLGCGCRCNAIGQVPRPELIGMARVRRKTQLEQPLRLARQVQHQHAVGGAKIERD